MSEGENPPHEAPVIVKSLQEPPTYAESIALIRKPAESNTNQRAVSPLKLKRTLTRGSVSMRSRVVSNVSARAKPAPLYVCLKTLCVATRLVESCRPLGNCV